MTVWLIAAAVAASIQPAASAPAASGSATTAAARGGPTVSYRVRRGENLVGLGRAYLRAPQDYAEVQRLNRIADPYHLRPASSLLIPARLLRSVPIAARIVAFRGTVTLDGARDARIGDVLHEGARIATGVNASVSFVLADKSKISLPSLSIIHIVRLRRTLLLGQVERVFLLESGRSDAEVTPSRKGRDPFEIRTPVSVAAVRGTIFRVAVVDSGQAATTGVVRGKVEVEGQGGGALVPAEYGVKSDATSTGKPTPLLPPPDFDPPVHIKPDGTQVFTLEPSAGATRYRLQVANDADFANIRTEVTQANPVFEVPPVPAGTYLVRATAIDANDVEGLPTTTYRYTYMLPRGAKPHAAAPPSVVARPSG